jgi:ABC-2 type transport system permease protein
MREVKIMKAYKTILKTELKLSLRGLDMLIFAIIMPIIVLIILGIIYGKKPAFEGASFTFIQQSFGALTSVSICAGGVMGLPLVVSDYRSKQILKRFKVTPVSPVTILLAEVTIYFLYALVSLLTLYAVAAVFFGFEMQGSILQFILGWILVMVSMFSIGMMVGGIAKNSKIAGIIASILYFPMLIFSGATLPYEVMPVPMQKIVNIMPLTQGIKILKSASLGMSMDNVLLPIVSMAVIAFICSFVAIRFFKWE